MIFPAATATIRDHALLAEADDTLADERAGTCPFVMIFVALLAIYPTRDAVRWEPARN